ncbi:MAG: DUF2997 domain-containing protein [Candidatus Gastranaerophilales bacterium]|nr:DUF2997 domain-containing protein [Candidatus Gastranaerophilales bacterium]
MTKKQLKITLLPNGEVKMETIGIKGEKCLDYIPFMEKLGDLKIVKKEFTEEYYETEVTNITNESDNVEIQDFNY